MNTTQTGFRPRNTTAPCRESDLIAGKGRVRTAGAEASESYFFCEVGGDLYAYMIFPLRDEFVTVTLLLGPTHDRGEGRVDLPTALGLLESSSLGGSGPGILEKKASAIRQKEMEEDDPAIEEPTKPNPGRGGLSPKPGPNPRE